MKLRERKKRVLVSIKQEDCKPSTLTNAHSSAMRATESTNTVNLTIKQEEIKEHKTRLKQDVDLDKESYRYRCDLCKRKMANFISVLEHRTSIHGIKQSSKRLIKNVDVEPDVHDRNFYCRTCEKGYSNTSVYRQHLRLVHYMILKPMPKSNTPKNGTDPDPNDPNFYCRACDFTYKGKSAYKKHCRYAHGLKLANSNRAATSSSLTDSYCHVCDKRLSSINSCRRHLFLIHKIDSRPIQQPERNDIMPDVNDPNFYCRSCEKKLKSKHSFTQHLKDVHSIFISAPKKSKLKPDVDDPNNHCRACQKTYVSKRTYRKHLRIVHQMTLSPLIGNVSREQLPDPYNPDYYCSVCKKVYSSLTNYRAHCKVTHLMELTHASILNPSAEINVNDPKFYCAQCERSFYNKLVFERHLTRIHSI